MSFKTRWFYVPGFSQANVIAQITPRLDYIWLLLYRTATFGWFYFSKVLHHVPFFFFSFFSFSYLAHQRAHMPTFPPSAPILEQQRPYEWTRPIACPYSHGVQTASLSSSFYLHALSAFPRGLDQFEVPMSRKRKTPGDDNGAGELTRSEDFPRSCSTDQGTMTPDLIVSLAWLEGLTHMGTKIHFYIKTKKPSNI